VLISHGARSGGGLIKGVIPADEKTVGDLLQSVVQGSAAELEPLALPCEPHSGSFEDCVKNPATANSLHPTLRGETAKDGAPGLLRLLLGEQLQQQKQIPTG